MSRGKMLSFRASGAMWVIPIADVLEILEAPPLIRLPLLPDSAPGIIALRGSAVPAIDVGRTDGSAHGSGRPAIVAGRGPRLLALLVDSVEDIVEEDAPGATEVDFESLLDTIDLEGGGA